MPKKIDLVLFHIFSWVCGIIIPVLFINPTESSVQYFQKWTLDVCFAAIYFYANIYWIVPRYLKKNRIKRYLFIHLLIGLLLIIQQYLTERFFNNLIFDTANVSRLIVGRGIITFLWIFVLSHRLSFMKYVRTGEKESIREVKPMDSIQLDEVSEAKLEA